MKMLVTPSSVGLITYLRVLFTYIIWGYLFRKNDANDCCYICGKSLEERRFELSIDRPRWGYESEYDEFLCIEHAIQTLLKYERREK